MQRIATGAPFADENPTARRLSAALAALVFATLLALAGAAQLSTNRGSNPTLNRSEALAAHGKLPLAFVPNRGQTDDSVRYQAHGGGFSFFFTDKKAVMSFSKGKRSQALELRFLGANHHPELVAQRPGEAKVNYLLEGERHTNLPTYRQVTYRELWPGIDMVFRGKGGRLKYEFHVRPGADPSNIRLTYRGADGLALGAAGNLLVQTPLGTIRDSRPRSYQRVSGKRVPVGSHYLLRGEGNSYGFALGSSYDPRHPLVIDPGLVYSTYLGGAGGEVGRGIAVDGSGAAYVTGNTSSADFPTSAGVYDASFNSGGNDAFVTKLNASGTALAYSTYLGGASDDQGWGIAVDSSGAAYVTGLTYSADFPTSAGAHDITIGGGGNNDVFVTKLNASGTALAYSTYVGGAAGDSGLGIAVDGSGGAYVTGGTNSSDFPTTVGAYDTTLNGGGSDAFVTKLNASGTALAYSTYVGGTGTFLSDYGQAIAVDGSGAAYFTGYTDSSDFPTTVGAYDTTHNGGGDAFVTKLNASGTALAYSTYMGGTAYDFGHGIAVDGSGAAYATGRTSSSDYPTTAGAYDSISSPEDAFVTKLNASGSALAYSTYVGGTSTDRGFGIAVDGSGAAYVTGSTSSSSFPTSTGAHDTSFNGSSDAFVTKLNASGSALSYSTYLGGAASDEGLGIAVDGSGAAYVAGSTSSVSFPTSTGAYDTSHNGGTDAFATKLDTLVGPPYPRPGGATPLAVPLVPAYGQCTSPDSQHVAPLAEPSCSSVALESALLKTGAIGQGSASARFTTQPGNPGTPADDADILIQVGASDVRRTIDNADYTGQLVFSTQMRITDTANGSSGEAQGTVQDFPFGIPVSCADNGGPGGGTCSLTSTADTLVPGFAQEGKRTLMAAIAISLLDAGANGSITPPAGTCPPTCGSGDENLFLRAGVFEP